MRPYRHRSVRVVLLPDATLRLVARRSGQGTRPMHRSDAVFRAAGTERMMEVRGRPVRLRQMRPRPAVPSD